MAILNFTELINQLESELFLERVDVMETDYRVEGERNKIGSLIRKLINEPYRFSNSNLQYSYANLRKIADYKLSITPLFDNAVSIIDKAMINGDTIRDYKNLIIKDFILVITITGTKSNIEIYNLNTTSICEVLDCTIKNHYKVHVSYGVSKNCIKIKSLVDQSTFTNDTYATTYLIGFNNNK